MSEDSKSEALQKEITQHKEELEKVTSELKRLFNEKDKVSDSMRQLFNQLKELKAKRLELIDQVSKNKTERNRINANVKELISRFKTQKQETGKLPEAGNPKELKSTINRIEWKIQTEVLPYEKEKALTKARKELEEELKTAEQKSKVYRGLRHTKTEIALKIAEEQAKHENVVKSYTEASTLRDQIKQLTRDIPSKRANFRKLADEILMMRKRINELRLLIGAKSKMVSEKRTRGIRKDLRDKLDEIKRKFKASKKLTTEDLIALQAAPDEEIPL
jgi:uncharacterized coiled-coil DUF342 family protein